MAQRGAKPKPQALRVLNGNAGKRPINYLEPDTGEMDLSPPTHLSAEALAHWKRTAPMLSKAGVLKASDFDLLAVYCETYAAHVAAVRDGGAPMSMVGQLRQLMGELGMTPSARARIQVDQSPELENGKGRFFN